MSDGYDPTAQANLELGYDTSAGVGDYMDFGGGEVAYNPQADYGMTSLMNQLNSNSFTDALKSLGGLFTGTTGGPLGQLAAFGGLSALLNKMGSSGPQAPVGYQGGIPKYTATREQLPIPTVTESGQARRPGQGGIQYFTPMQYTAEGETAAPVAAPAVSAAQQAANQGLAALPYATGTRATDAQIAQLYKDVFNREIDPQGLAFYRASGFSPSQIKEQLLASPEYKGLLGSQAQQYATGEDANAEAIKQIYKDVLGREADPGGLAFYDQSKFSPEQIRADILKSPEYQSLHPADTNEQALTNLYKDVFNREPDPEGFQFWLDAMNNMGYTPEMVRSEFMKSPEYTGRKTTTDQSTRQTAMAGGGITMLAGGRYLRGPGDGVSDSIPAKFERSGQPARLADGEFVIDARTVSEIGNGSSDAGARKLYAMMDRVHKARKTAKRGEASGADKYLPK